MSAGTEEGEPGRSVAAIWYGETAAKASVVMLSFDDYRPLTGPLTDPCRTKGSPDPDSPTGSSVPDSEKWVKCSGSCSATFISEHALLTAAHCAPLYKKEIDAGGKFHVTAFDPLRERSFRAQLTQRLSATRLDQCLGPAGTKSRNQPCRFYVTAYPFEHFRSVTETMRPMTQDDIGRDVAMLFLPEVFPLPVNDEESVVNGKTTRQPLEPEALALPIAMELPDVADQEKLIPWGWGALKDAWLDPQGNPENGTGELRRPQAGRGIFLTANPPDSQEYLFALSNAESDGGADARICHGDSGGPLLRRITADGREAVVALASTIDGGGDCTGALRPMYWVRVDTFDKRQWITRTLQLFYGASFGCQTLDTMLGNKSVSSEACWHPLCPTSGVCPDTADVCKSDVGYVSLTGVRAASAPRPRRCVPKGY